jgi:mannosyl-oligosaccharide alpha-1,2-mannosidase
MVFTSKGNLTYLAELRSGSPDHKMSHLACFVPGMFALEAMAEKNARKKAELIRLAEALAHTCHESYRRSNTGIGPEVFYFELGSEAMTT